MQIDAILEISRIPKLKHMHVMTRCHPRKTPVEMVSLYSNVQSPPHHYLVCKDCGLWIETIIMSVIAACCYIREQDSSPDTNQATVPCWSEHHMCTGTSTDSQIVDYCLENTPVAVFSTNMSETINF